MLQCALLGDAAGSFQAATAKRAMADAGEAQARRVKDKKAKKKKAKKASKSAQSPSDRGTKRRREGACLRKLAHSSPELPGASPCARALAAARAAHPTSAEKSAPSGGKAKRKGSGKGGGLDINEMFASAKSKRAEAEAAAEAAAVAAEAEAAAIAARVKRLSEAGAAANRLRGDDSPTPLRFDAELGMNIYSLDALKVGKGGGTDLCPFDCDCCF